MANHFLEVSTSWFEIFAWVEFAWISFEEFTDSASHCKANKNIGNGLVILILLAVILCAIGFVCRPQILGLFGGNPNEVECYGYATDYFKIICAGIPFYMIGQGLNAIIFIGDLYGCFINAKKNTSFTRQFYRN